MQRLCGIGLSQQRIGRFGCGLRRFELCFVFVNVLAGHSHVIDVFDVT